MTDDIVEEVAKAIWLKIEEEEEPEERPAGWDDEHPDHQATMRAAARAAIATMDRLRRAAPEWQPISTAPKDGTRVLAFRPGWAEDIGIALWSKHWEEWQSIPGLWRWEPTHWMPLPSPPGEQAAAVAGEARGHD